MSGWLKKLTIYFVSLSIAAPAPVLGQIVADNTKGGNTALGTSSKGTITVGGNTETDLTGLNREVSLAQEITKDKITGALNGSLTIDHNTLINNPTDILTGGWNAPNTLLGAANGLANIYYAAVKGPYVETDEDGNVVRKVPLNVKVENGVLSITGGQLNFGNGAAISLGRIITYYEKWNPDSEKRSGYSPKMMILLGAHENWHVTQSSLLGPFYLPVYLISGGISAGNWMETQADEAGNKALLDKKKTK